MGSPAMRFRMPANAAVETPQSSERRGMDDPGVGCVSKSLAKRNVGLSALLLEYTLLQSMCL